MGLVEVCIRICVTLSLWILADQAAASRGSSVESLVVRVDHPFDLATLRECKLIK